jgi:hypothetical protein
LLLAHGSQSPTASLTHFEQSDFHSLAERVEELLKQANMFIRAAALTDKAADTTSNGESGKESEAATNAAFLREQGQEAVKDALSLLNDPEFLTDPKMALKKAELVYMGARVSSGLLSTEYSRKFYDLLPTLSTDIGSDLLSKAELDFIAERLVIDKATRELVKLLNKAKREKAEGFGKVIILFGVTYSSDQKNVKRLEGYLGHQVVPPESYWFNIKIPQLRRNLGSESSFENCHHGTFERPFQEFPLAERPEYEKLIVNQLINLGYTIRYEIWFEQFKCTETLYLVV